MSSSNPQNKKIILIKKNPIKSRNHNSSADDLIKSHITREEMINYPEIKSLLSKGKFLHFGKLTPYKTKLSNLSEKDNLKRESQIKIIKNVNSFSKIFHEYYNFYRKQMSTINDLGDQNHKFFELFKKLEIKNKNNNAKKIDKFKEIKNQYEKQNYQVPDIPDNNNLFSGNILLSSDADLKKYIVYGLASQKSNSKSIGYLEKVNQEVDNRESIIEDQLEKIEISGLKPKTKRKKRQKRTKIQTINLFQEFNKKVKTKLIEIEKEKNEINQISKNIQSINEIDYFFDVDNKTYLEQLKNNNSNILNNNNNNTNNYSKVSTSANCDFNLGKLSANKKVSFNDDALKTTKTKVLRIFKRSKTFLLNKTTEVFDKYKTLDDNNITNSILTKVNKLKINLRSCMKRRLSLNQNQITKTNLETLYNKVKKKDDPSMYDSEIRCYLARKNYIILPKINAHSVCNNMEKIKEKICNSNIMKDNMNLRKFINYNMSKANQLCRNEMEVNKSIIEAEDKMIKVYSD